MESQFSNTRLFFGVESETQTLKSKSDYNLKVPHIGLTQIISQTSCEFHSIYGLSVSILCLGHIGIHRDNTWDGRLKENGKYGLTIVIT